MANTVQNMPVNVMPQAQQAGPVVPNNDRVIDDSAADSAAAQASKENRTYETDSQNQVENPNNNETNATQGKGEDFQEVLERKLSNKPEDKGSTADNDKPKNSENKTKDTPDENNHNLAGLLDLTSQNITKILKGKGEENAPVILVKTNKDARPVAKKNTQQKIVDIPLQTVAKDTAGTQQKGDAIAAAATQAAKAKKPTDEGATKGSEVKQAVNDAIGKDAKDTIAKSDNVHSTDKPVENNKLNAGKLTAQQIATAKQNEKAAQNNNAINQTDAKKTTTENTGMIDAAKTLETMEKTVKPEVLLPKEGIDNKIVGDLKEGIPESVRVKPNDNAANQNLEQALNEQNAKTENKKIDANVNFNYTKAQNDTAVSNTAQAPAANVNHNTSSVSGVQSVTSASRTDAAQPQSPSEQIIDAVKNQNVTPERQINITLNPEELGRVRISFQQSNGEITGLVEVEKAQTRVDVEKAIPQIVNSLQDSGVNVKKIEVAQDTSSDARQQQSELADQFEQAGNKGYSDGPGNSRQDQTATPSRNSQLGNDYQQTKTSVTHITDDAISAYA